jgi:hypothetical protein
MQRVHAAVAEQPGYLHDDHQPPDARHPDEWVVTYQFTDTDALEAWLASPIRRKLMGEGRELIVGEPREQVLAVAGVTDARPVTAVISSRVKPGREADYRDVHDDIEVALASTEGFLRCELFEAVPGVQPDTIVVFAFDTREHLDAWLDSDARRAIIRRLEPLVEGERTLNVVGGFAGWFSSDGDRPVKRWKQSLAVLLGLFPVSLAVAVLRDELAPGLPLVPGVLVGNVVGVTMLGYVLMPIITRRLSGWLRR